MIEKDAKDVYVVPWEANEDKNAFNDTEKYGFYPHPTEMGMGNAAGKVDLVIFKPLPALKEGNVLNKKIIEVLSDEEVYKYLKEHKLLSKLREHGIRYTGLGKHKPMVWSKGKSWLPKTWYACIDYREKPTLLTIRSMLLPFFEFANVEIVDECVPDAQKWLKEGKLTIGDGVAIREHRLQEVKEAEEKRNAGRDIKDA